MQAQSRGAVTTGTDDFQKTVQRSGLIFEGTVTAVQCEFAGTSGRSPQPRAYRISFQVKQGLRGVATGATLTIREWAGLWAPGQQPLSSRGARRPVFVSH